MLHTSYFYFYGSSSYFALIPACSIKQSIKRHVFYFWQILSLLVGQRWVGGVLRPSPPSTWLCAWVMGSQYLLANNYSYEIINHANTAVQFEFKLEVRNNFTLVPIKFSSKFLTTVKITFTWRTWPLFHKIFESNIYFLALMFT